MRSVIKTRYSTSTRVCDRGNGAAETASLHVGTCSLLGFEQTGTQFLLGDRHTIQILLLGTDALAQNLFWGSETGHLGYIYKIYHSNKVIETAGVGKFDKIQQPEQEEFRHCWQQTHSFKEEKKPGKFLEEDMSNC